MQFALCSLHKFTARACGIEVLDELDKLLIDILCIYCTGTSLRNICLQLIDIVVIAATSSATCEEFAITL